MNYIFNFTFDVDPIALSNYCKYSPIDINGEIVEGRKVTVICDDDLTSSEITELRNYVELFENFSQETLDMDTISITKRWGRDIINEFELRNMNRKRNGEMGRVELHDILAEAHDSFVFITMVEGSLDTLHGILYGFPEETINEIIVPGKAAFVFNKVWIDDINWIKSELNIILGTL